MISIWRVVLFIISVGLWRLLLSSTPLVIGSFVAALGEMSYVLKIYWRKSI